ncbi:MAG: FIG00461543: hypothetical protein [uncultured Paraburkholderia sp.]|nr:MAG: FIG00461543: hypothetical protein [uncultured Paraburkholderia sp.]
MKLRLLMAVVSAVLFLAPRAASADNTTTRPGAELSTGTSAGSSASHRLMQHANESAQATTDMSLSEPAASGSQVSYGGVATGRSEAGARQNMPCSARPQCMIYFGQ